jgi:ATP-binding cassette subfamily F protein 3
MLAKAILQGQDVLLLDEPTNHLDLPSLRWLESFINETTATVAVISHDRYFLDKIATSILEIEFGRSRVYEGNYSEFMDKKEQELEIAEKHYEQQQAYIKKQEDYIRRNIAGQNTKIARGRRTHLQKLQRMEKPLKDRRRVKFKFQETQRSGDVALVMDGVTAGWDGTPLFEPIEHLQVKRGQKLAIVGLNGTGKSTLLKAIGEHIPFMGGTCRQGSQVKLGYFDQHHGNLDPRNNVFQQVLASGNPLAPKQDIYGFLAKFQFHEEDWEKPVTVLSGGERARLSIASLIRQGCNLLLLDEPTNHMDIHSMEAMEDAILSFEGAVVLVTHDRYLLGRVADSLLRIHDNKAEYREGAYEDHQAWVDLDLGHEPTEEEEERNESKIKTPKTSLIKPSKHVEESKLSSSRNAPIDREKQKSIKRWERKAGEAEAKVGELEKKLAAMNQELATMDPADWKIFQEKLDAQKLLESELAYAMTEWEEAQTALEEARNTS